MRIDFAGLVLLLLLASACEGEDPVPTFRPAPESLGVLLDRVRNRLRVGDDAGAEEGYREVLVRQPDHAASLYALALLLDKRGEREEALRLLERLVEVDGIPSRGRLLMARILIDSTRETSDPVRVKALLTRAEAEARAAVETNPEDSGTHATLGRILLLARNWPAAERSLQRALGVNPNDEDSALRLAIARVADGRTPAAIEGLHDLLAGTGERPEREGVLEEGDTEDGSAAARSEGTRPMALLRWLEQPEGSRPSPPDIGLPRAVRILVEPR